MSASPPDISFMRELEGDFIRECMGGACNPSKFKIFYSGINRSPAIFLGINPAGTAENFKTAHQSYEEWGHDFLEYEFDPNYKLAKGAVRFLRRLVGAQTGNADDVVRQIPVSNVCFLRSQNPKNLTDENYDDCAPYVRRLLDRVDPIVAVTIGEKAFLQLEKILDVSVIIQENTERLVTTANGRSRAALYQSYKVDNCQSRLRMVLRLGHLSKFGLGRDEDWAVAYAYLESDLTEIGLRPFVMN